MLLVLFMSFILLFRTSHNWETLVNVANQSIFFNKSLISNFLIRIVWDPFAEAHPGPGDQLNKEADKLTEAIPMIGLLVLGVTLNKCRSALYYDPSFMRRFKGAFNGAGL